MRKLNTNSYNSEYRKPQVLRDSKSWYFERLQKLRLLGVYGEVEKYMRDNSMNPFAVIENAVTYLLTVGELREFEKRGITNRKYGVHVVNSVPLHKMPGYWDACDAIIRPEDKPAKLEERMGPRIADVRTVARKTKEIHKNRFRLVKTGN